MLLLFRLCFWRVCDKRWSFLGYFWNVNSTSWMQEMWTQVWNLVQKFLKWKCWHESGRTWIEWANGSLDWPNNFGLNISVGSSVVATIELRTMWTNVNSFRTHYAQSVRNISVDFHLYIGRCSEEFSDFLHLQRHWKSNRFQNSIRRKRELSATIVPKVFDDVLPYLSQCLIFTFVRMPKCHRKISKLLQKTKRILWAALRPCGIEIAKYLWWKWCDNNVESEFFRGSAFSCQRRWIQHIFVSSWLKPTLRIRHFHRVTCDVWNVLIGFRGGRKMHATDTEPNTLWPHVLTLKLSRVQCSLTWSNGCVA